MTNFLMSSFSHVPKLRGPLALFFASLLFFATTPEALAQQTGQITGTVTSDATGDPLPGVNVVVEGTQQGASTGAEGSYTIEGLEPGTYTLVASFVGYGEESREGVEVTAGETTTVDIVLQQQAVGLDEVVAIGYGEQQQRDLTGAVSSVSAEDLEAAPVTSTDAILQGRVAGAQVTQSSGEPGGGLTVRVRGTGSIIGGGEPLYVIDGMPVQNDASEVPGPDYGGVMTRPNQMASLNPQDIASINVLKDASATAIYGSRGANGVVLIQTKQGRAGDTRVNFSSYLGMQRIVKMYDVLNASQFAELANEALVARGQEPYFDNPSSMGEGTDWQDEIYNPAPMQNYQLSASGGDENTKFLLSGNYFDQRGILKNTGFDRYAFRVNLNQDVSSRFRLGSSTTISRSLYDQARTADPWLGGPSSNARRYPPILPVRNEEADRYSWAGQDLPYGVAGSGVNPVGHINEVDDKLTTDRVLGNAFAEYDLLEGLQLRTSFGADIQSLSRNYYESENMLLQFQQGGYARGHQFNKTALLSETTLRYNGTFGESHDLDLTGGFTWQNEDTKTSNIQDSGFLVPEDLFDVSLGSGSQEGGPNVSSGRASWTLLSYLGRVNYTLNDKYLFTLTGRYDGSSKFGAGNQWGFFPSGALAWRVSEEPFMQEQDLVSNLKARISYGVTGNQAIGTYQALARLSAGQYVFGTSPVPAYVPGSLANPNLKWETARQLDVGLDLGLWGQRVRLTADYYRKITDDLLLPVTLPDETGFGSSVQNAGSMRNTGVEFSLGADPLGGISDAGFTWSTNATLAVNRNEVTKLGTGGRFFGNPFAYAVGGGGMVAEGYPIGVYYGYETDGIFADEAAVEAHGAQPEAQPGDVKFVDANGDGEISEEDRTVIGNPHPDFTYGWTNNFSYKGFQLNVFLQGVSGTDVMNADLDQLEGLSGDLEGNSTVRRFEGRWTPENRNAAFPRAGYTVPGNLTLNDRVVEDGTYLRLKNVTLSYNLPMSLIGISGVSNARIYVKGRNLLTFTGYSGYNPDVNTNGQGTINMNVSGNVYPLAREYIVGINLGF